jgi:hypothetical protein
MEEMKCFLQALLLTAAVLVGFWSYVQTSRRDQDLRQEREKAEAEKEALRVERNKEMVCPHCQQKGAVHTSPITKKIGISGGKATAAIITGGVSLIATGLSRKEAMTEARCDNCGAIWHY